MKVNTLKTLILILFTISATQAQTQQKTEMKKTREAMIYLIKGSPIENGDTAHLVPVKRQVSASAPLAGVMKALLKGANEKDEDDIYSVISGLIFVSAQIKNRTARIDFKYDIEELDEGEEYSWGATERAFFPDAVEKTVLQFEGIKRVVVCVEGLESYDSPDSFYHRKCPKVWWKKEK